MPSNNSSNSSIRWIALSAAVLAGVMIPILKFSRRSPAPSAPVTRAVETPPTTAPAKGPVVSDFMKLVSLYYPDFPSTRPLDAAVDFADSAHLVIPDPLTVDSIGALWIHHVNGAEPVVAARKPAQVNIVNRKVRFVHRWRSQSASSWNLALVVPSKTREGFDLVEEHQTRPLTKGDQYDWSSAVSLQDGTIAVPTGNGVSLFAFSSRGAFPETQSPPLLADPSVSHAPIRLIEFNHSLIAWIPPKDNHPGSSGAIRWSDGAWVRLQGDHWPDHLVHLIPLYDSVIQLIGSEQSARVVTVSMGLASVSENELTEKILQLGDVDPQKRDAAELQLSKYRDTLWPVADKLMDKVPPEVQIRLQNLLRARDNPMLGNCEPANGKVRLLNRYPSGGCLLYNPDGAKVPNGSDEPLEVKPAWILVDPGAPIHALQGEFLTDLDPDVHQLFYTASGQWIVQDPASGPRLLLAGNNWLKLTRKGEDAFTVFDRSDSAGRLLFRTDPTSPNPTLLIDPKLPDARPKLPIWTMEYDAVGWNKKDYPAILYLGNAMFLNEDHWPVIDSKTDALLTKSSEIPAIASTWPSHLGQPLAKDEKGNLFFGGESHLVLLTPAGEQSTFSLPADAMGTLDKPSLACAGNGRLLLYNKPGQISRLRLADGGLKLEAVFKQGAPDAKQLTRMWIDPHKRLVMVWDKKMALGFPQGYIPKPTRLLIPANALPKEEEENP
jgi:hypothetical protein